jgi:hypothetical protein
MLEISNETASAWCALQNEICIISVRFSRRKYGLTMSLRNVVYFQGATSGAGHIQALQQFGLAIAQLRDPTVFRIIG